MADQKISELTEDTSPDGAADFIPTVDTSASGNKKVKPNTILGLVNGLTEDTSPAASSDFVLTYDTSASAPKKVKPSNLVNAAFSGCMVKKSADQTGANFTTVTTLAWDAEIYDVGGWHDNVTNNSRLTVPSGVNYVEIAAAVRLANLSADQWVSISVLKNGSSTFDGACHQFAETGASLSMIAVRSGAIPVVAGDYFELVIQVEADTSTDVIAARSNFSIRAVG